MIITDLTTISIFAALTVGIALIAVNVGYVIGTKTHAAKVRCEMRRCDALLEKISSVLDGARLSHGLANLEEDAVQQNSDET